jgi:hypothetical protein
MGISTLHNHNSIIRQIRIDFRTILCGAIIISATLAQSPIVSSTVGTGSGLLARYYHIPSSGSNNSFSMDYFNGTPLKTEVLPWTNWIGYYSDKDRLWIEKCNSCVSLAIHWSGKLEPQFTEEYTFYTAADNNSVLRIDGKTVVESSRGVWDPLEREYVGTMQLEAGKRYTIDFYFILWGHFDQEVATYLMLESASTVKQLIPPTQLYPADGSAEHPYGTPWNSPHRGVPKGVEISFYPQENFGGSPETTKTWGIEHLWNNSGERHEKCPMTLNSWAGHSVRATGKLMAQYSEEYTFHIYYIGKTAELKLDGKTVGTSNENMWWPCLSDCRIKTTLEAGKVYDLELSCSYFTGNTKHAFPFMLWWESPSTQPGLIPITQYSDEQLGGVGIENDRHTGVRKTTPARNAGSNKRYLYTIHGQRIPVSEARYATPRTGTRHCTMVLIDRQGKLILR